MRFDPSFCMLALVALVALAPVSNARASSDSAGADGASWACWYQAAARYRVSPELLFSIAHVETRVRSGVIHRNDNGTYDVGVMQINSTWLPVLAKYHITLHDIATKPCVNVNVGAWILSRTIEKYGLNWRGVGAYNAASDALRARYANKVAAALRRIGRQAERGEVAER